MENEKNKRINSKRTDKYRKLVESLEEERREIESSKQQKEPETYDEDIHRIIDELEADARIDCSESAASSETINDEENDDCTEDDWSLSKTIPILAACVLGTILLIGLVFIVCIRLINGSGTETAYEPVQETEVHLMDPDLRSMWLNNKQINEDYVGQIIFDSGLIDLPFVQAKDVYKLDGTLYTFYDREGNPIEDPEGHTGNDVYIWTNWKTGEYDRSDEGGSVFMDYRNYLKDQNIIIYGHHFARDWDSSGSKQFTPLDVLLTQENYEENKHLKLILDNEIRSYVVTNVFTIDIDDEYESQIIRTDMNEDFSGNREPRFFREFIEYMNRISRYDTGEDLTGDDRILTLITCLEHQPQYRQIVVCKETGRDVYDVMTE